MVLFPGWNLAMIFLNKITNHQLEALADLAVTVGGRLTSRVSDSESQDTNPPTTNPPTTNPLTTNQPTTMQLVLNTHGLVIKVKDRVFHISAGDEYRRLSPEQIDSIAVTAPCLFSSAAIILAADAGIPVYFFDRTGDARSCLRSPYFESLATLRRKQVYFSDSLAGAIWVIAQFQEKTAHQLQLLTYLKNRKVQYADRINNVITDMQAALEQLEQRAEVPNKSWSASLMGWEGSQAKRYWQCLGQCLPEQWQFKKRSRRPAIDPFNALINYAYGMLYNKVEQALFAAGLDPHLGILHVDQYDRPTLAYDLIEAFRPWIDRLIVEKILTAKVDDDFFEPIDGGLFLSNNGKRFLIPSVNEWLQIRVRWQNRQQSREGHIFRAAAELAKHINESVKRPQ